MREILFVLLILTPLAIAATNAVACLRQGNARSVFHGLCAAALTFVVWMVLLHPLAVCESYDRIGIILTISVGIYVSVYLAHRQWVRVVCLTSIYLSSVLALILLYAISDGYRDNPRPKPYMVARESATKRLAAELLLTSADRMFPAGDVTSGSPILTALSVDSRTVIEADLAKWGYSWHVIRRWHTWLTGMYRVDRTPMRLWYPGGKVKEAIVNFTWH